MKEAIIKRIQECWPRLCDEVEDGDRLESTMVIATGNVEGRRFQIQLRILLDEDEFMDTGHGEVKL